MWTRGYRFQSHATFLFSVKRYMPDRLYEKSQAGLPAFQPFWRPSHSDSSEQWSTKAKRVPFSTEKGLDYGGGSATAFHRLPYQGLMATFKKDPTYPVRQKSSVFSKVFLSDIGRRKK
jgi:hypothetical protein